MSVPPQCEYPHPRFYIRNEFTWFFFSWYIPIMNVLAIIFSGLCITILIRHPRMFASSTRVWFLALITSDFFTILIASTDMYAEVMFPDQYRTVLATVFGPFMCVIRVSIVVCLQWSSNLLQTGLSIERMVSVISPLKARAFSTGKLTRIIIVTLVTFACTAAFAVQFATVKSQPVSINNYSAEGYMCPRYNVTEMFGENSTLAVDVNQMVYHFDLIIFRIIPFIVMFLTSAIITRLIHSQRRRRDEMVSANSAILIRYRGSATGRECRASLILLAINVTTLLTNPLFLIFELLDGEGSEGKPDTKLTGDVCVSLVMRHFFNALLYFNNQTNWIFYITFGARFRVHIVNMFWWLRCGGRVAEGSMAVSQVDMATHSVPAIGEYNVRKQIRGIIRNQPISESDTRCHMVEEHVKLTPFMCNKKGVEASPDS